MDRALEGKWKAETPSLFAIDESPVPAERRDALTLDGLLEALSFCSNLGGVPASSKEGKQGKQVTRVPRCFCTDTHFARRLFALCAPVTLCQVGLLSHDDVHHYIRRASIIVVTMCSEDTSAPSSIRKHRNFRRQSHNHLETRCQCNSFADITPRANGW